MVNIKLRDQYPTDENGLPHGEWISVYSDGKLKSRHNYFHGVYHGLHEWYYDDGIINYRGNFNMNIRVGIWNYFYRTNECYLCLI